MIVLFGYIARMARAGTVEALGSDYVRTAVLKGLPRRTVIRRHVLRNSLLPTITVIATQTGYLIGGLVVVEVLFRYNGIGMLTYNAANQPLYDGSATRTYNSLLQLTSMTGSGSQAASTSQNTGMQSIARWR